MNNEPFVSIVTPVYNGETFLAECIESVLVQGYSNWEYIIVNNCSTDCTLGIANRYASLDARVRVLTNPTFVDAIRNHNIAVASISPSSKYCKVVSADDWITPDCLARMVELAEAHPKVGIVGSYQRSNDEIKWKGLPKDATVISGREACRMHFLNSIYVFGSPTTVLYRSDLIRRRPSFYPHSEPHADTSACFASLSDCDFGFVHEVLSHERVHEAQISSRVHKLEANEPALMEMLHRYGPLYLTEVELLKRQEEVLASYYVMLGRAALKMAGREFWQFHKRKLDEFGYPLNRRRLLAEVITKASHELRRPIAALRKFECVLAQRTR
jgi:glycosyltransferase involved in cell wall biosynthesis